MKARLFLLGLCSLALAATACSVDETPQTNTATNAISFKATAPYASRAAAVTTNSLNSFTVWGWTGSGTVMDHVTATRDGGGSVYSTSPTYYWPGDAVDFLALTPAADANLYDGTSKTSYIGGEFSGYEIKEEGGTAEEYTGYVAEAVIDPMEGEGSVRLNVPSDSKDQIDLCYAYTPDRTAGTVTMNFRHALSQITFAARTTNTEQEVRIKGVKVCSVGNWGVLDLPFVTTETNLPTDDIGTDGISDSQGTWELGPVYNGTQFSAGLGLVADGYITVPTDGTPVTLSASDGSLLLIPQEVAEWDTGSDPTLDGVGAYFRVECAILGEDGSLLWPNDETSEFAEIAIPVDVTWVEGYKYTYTFVFGDGAGYYPPDDATDPGEPIPFLPIKFDINIDEFQGTDGTDVSTEPAPVPIDYFDYIVDENFLSYMQKFDRNEDGHLYYDELEYITEIKCGDYEDDADSNYKATDFTGIEYYYNLTSFTSNTVECTSQSFEKDNEEGLLDLSGNTNLSYIYIPKTNVVKVDLRNTNLTETPSSAFQQCASLTTVVLPDCIESIGAQSFAYCYALNSINIPKGVKSLGNFAFYNCSALTSVSLPETLETIGSDAFDYSGLTSVTIPDSVTSLGEYAFYYCTSLASAKLSSELTVINDATFRNCTSLTSIEIPNKVTSLGQLAFYSCTKLTSVSFTATPSLTSIGYETFYKCSKLSSIIIPEGVTSIGEAAFEECGSLASVSLPSTLISIGECAFSDCESLSSITIPASVKTIEDKTFYGCYNIASVIFSDGSDLRSIGDNAFYDCGSLTSITVPEGVTSIGVNSFYLCSGMLSIDLPSTMREIGSTAFAVNSSLLQMTIRAADPPTLGNLVFDRMNSSAILYVPEESISEYSGVSDYKNYFYSINAIEN